MQLLGQPQALTDQAQPPGRLRKQLQILARERPLLARDGQGPVRRVIPMLAVRGPCLLHEALTFIPAVPHPLTVTGRSTAEAWRKTLPAAYCHDLAPPT